jgi:hypothetical protein
MSVAQQRNSATSHLKAVCYFLCVRLSTNFFLQKHTFAELFIATTNWRSSRLNCKALCNDFFNCKHIINLCSAGDNICSTPPNHKTNSCLGDVWLGFAISNYTNYTNNSLGCLMCLLMRCVDILRNTVQQLTSTLALTFHVNDKT